MAKFDPCAVLPDPSAQQAVVKSINRNGCYYRLKNGWRRKHPGPRFYCTRFGVTTLWGNKNWSDFRKIAYHWKHVLNDSQRLAWDTLAELVPFLNYYGQAAYQDGYAIFQKLNRIWLKAQPWSIKSDPPGAWDALEQPPLVGYEWYPPFLVILYPFDFNPPPQLFAGSVITRDPKTPGRFPMHYTCETPRGFAQGEENWFTDFDLTCPLFHNRTPSQCTIGVYHARTDTGMFTDFFWIRLP